MTLVHAGRLMKTRRNFPRRSLMPHEPRYANEIQERGRGAEGVEEWRATDRYCNPS